MAVPQLTLGQVLSALRQSLHSVDLRTAVVRHNDSETPLFVVMRLSARSPEKVAQHHAELDGRMVSRTSPRLSVVSDVLPLQRIDFILNRLSLGILPVAGREMTIPKSIDVQSLTGWVSRSHLYVRVWDRSPSAAYFSAAFLEPEQLTSLWNDPSLAMEVQNTSGLQSCDQMVSAFLEITGPSRLAVNFVCYVEMPGWIERATSTDHAIQIEAFAEPHLRTPRLFVTFSAPRQGPLINRELILDEVRRDEQYRRLRGGLGFDRNASGAAVSCVLTCEGLPALDYVTLSLRADSLNAGSGPTRQETKQMGPESNPYKIVSEQLHSLRASATEININANGPGQSGISVLVKPFNAYLEQTRTLLGNDPAALATISHIDPLRPLQEHLDASYHRKTRQAILTAIPLLLHALAGKLPVALEPPKFTSRDVFIVHGRDSGMKDSVARFIEQLGLGCVVLHEQPNQGRTIIEKFIGHADVGFAVVLLGADDKGGPASDPPSAYVSRARQNVILELGYFLGRLGRERVCVLYQDGVEIPSDYQGVLFVQFDTLGAWRQALAREIRAAGVDIDFNRI
jgi:predicted nucleotide-binding protein